MFISYSKRVKWVSGFTLLEAIFMVLIMGIMAIYLAPKWTVTGMGAQFEARRVLQDIRYTQALSVSTGQRYRWVRTSASTYQILNEAGTAIVLPNGSTTQTFTNNVTFGTLTNLPSSLVAFDSRGVPYTTSTIPGTALATAATIPVTAGGLTATVQISPQTGYGAVI